VRSLRLTAGARRDIAAILTRSAERFGLPGRRRYRQLLSQAFFDLRTDPTRAGVRADPDLDPALHLYPVRFSRPRLAAADRVAHPRHVVVFTADAQRVEVVRVLDEAMDLAARLRGP